MQIAFHIVARPSLRESLREIIIADLDKGQSELEVEYEKKNSRPNGWAKIRAKGLHGVINITWDPTSKTLIARAIAKQGNTPNALLSRFIAYLLDHRRRDVRTITIHSS